MSLPFFTKPIGVFISLSFAFLSAYIAFACAGGDWEDGYESNFTPETFIGNKSYHPFFFSYLFYYGIYYDVEHNTRFNQNNVDDWQGYLGKNVPQKALSYWLNEVPEYETGQLNDYLQGKRNNIGGEANAQKHAESLKIAGEKAQNFAVYLNLAKKCENFAALSPINYWEYDPKTPKPDKSSYKAVVAGLFAGFEATQDPFLKQRYWFQIVRYYFYFEPAQAIAFFDKHQAIFAKNTIYWRSLAYVAGAYYKQKDYAKANYYYSRVFDADNQLKTVAHFSFHPQEESDWKKTLALCKNNDEKAALWQMLGIFYDDEIRSIKEIYALDPKSPKIDLLLTRMVNKIERKYDYESSDEEVEDVLDKNGDVDYMATEQKRQEVYRAKKAKKVAADLQWIAAIADKDNTANPFLWNVTTGYLYFLSGNSAKVGLYYQKADKQLPTTNQILAKKQMRLLKLLAQIDGLKKIEPKNENDLLADLQWLYAQEALDSTDHFRANEAQRWVKETLNGKYAAQKDFVKAECWLSNTNFYTNPNNVGQLKAFLEKNGKTPYEQFCAQMSYISAEDIWEYQAVLDAFAEKIDDAVAKMQKAGKNGKIELLGNPFNGKIKDCHDCDHEAIQKIKYAKLSFLQKMAEMKQKLDKKDDPYNNALLLGNAYYNITHYGNARYFYEGKIIQGAYSPYALDSNFVQMLTDNSLALKYYNIALQNAADNEQKAKCHYLIAKCERNKWYNENKFNDISNEYAYYSDDNENAIDFVEWGGFKALKKYADTKYYREVLKECGYFQKVVQK